MRRSQWPRRFIGWPGVLCVGFIAEAVLGAAGDLGAEKADQGPQLRQMLDAPLLFVKRHSYRGIHIYDTFYKWVPGGGIYVIENPSAPPKQHRIRAVIDAKTPETLGGGIYSDPELSWDGKRLLFCYKPNQNGSTSIYEIGIDGKGLRRLTDPSPYCSNYKGSHGGVHDVSPAYLPDGRIVFTSTRGHGLVPCANEGVDILHIMNADGTDIHVISVNNVNEFDPCVLPDGRILHGRWEYMDKTALTQQSVWTIFADGTNETALFANNMVHPEALLDARPVPGSPDLVFAAFTPHNSPPRGSIGLVDTRLGKNGPGALVNFEHPDDPMHDRGNSCEPWPLSKDVVVFSGRPKGLKYNAIEIMDRTGRRELIHAEPDICCHSPMLVKPRSRAPVLAASTQRQGTAGRFLVHDIYHGLTGVKRGEVKQLRVIEETSRVSATPGGAMNQTFLMSAVLAWSAKNFLGVVPVESDGSAYFEVPSGRAVYLQALDAEGRLIQSMRTFVQAAPGVTRSCIGCHEDKYTTPSSIGTRLALQRSPSRPKPESWGSGFLDYPSMIQPIMDKHCVRCHGGEEGFAAKLDLTGGWTEHFSISYENLISRRETQVTAYLISGIDCMNGTSRWSAQIFPPRSHGSATAPMAKALVSGHKGRLPNLTRRERDLLLAWIDTNGLYHGTWNYTKHGCRMKAWVGIRQDLFGQMRAAGCTRCHEDKGKIPFESDWFNLERPEFSRILRAPLAKGTRGWGQAMCRDRRVDPKRQRVRILATGSYIHHVLPMEQMKPKKCPPSDSSGKPVVTFASTEDPHYQAMLAVIRRGRRLALAEPRADMPGAELEPGRWRQLIPPPLPDPLPALEARVDAESVARLSWERSARTIGLVAEIHRDARADFNPNAETLLAKTPIFQFADLAAPQGKQHYAVVLLSGSNRSAPIRAGVSVPAPEPPPTPEGLEASPGPGQVMLQWRDGGPMGTRYHVYRVEAGTEVVKRLTAKPVFDLRYSDSRAGDGAKYAYTVRAVSRRGIESAASRAVVAAALPEIKAPLFVAAFAENAHATLYGGGTASGYVRGKARVKGSALDLRQGGHVAFHHRPEFDLSRRLSVECWVRLTKEGKMPVIASCGHWRQDGWFLQRIGAGWRWHVGGIDCDGGKPAPRQWTHLAGTFDGQTARLFQDGHLVAEKPGNAIRTPTPDALYVGQYNAGPGPAYQVLGQIAALKIYNRSLSEQDTRAACQVKPAVR